MFMVFFELDTDAMCYPMGNDPACVGALQASSDKPVLFDTRKQARKAITISTRWALLREAQGLPVNEDFTTQKHCLQIRAVCNYKEKAK